MRALGCMVFGGSQTIGWMQSGFEVDRILEMTDDMIDNNAYHFSKNYPDIEIVPPSTWDNPEYLSNLKYDVVFGNPPCSGLSRINQWAKAGNDVNKHIYEVINVVDAVKPKVFFIENAPTLSTYGLPILKDIENKIGNQYRLLVINDVASNHKVAMGRRRTFLIGFNRDHFSAIPKIDQVVEDKFTIKDALAGLTNESPNMEFDKNVFGIELQPLYHLVKTGDTILNAMYHRYYDIQPEISPFHFRCLTRYKERKDRKDGVWDKSAKRVDANGLAPSMGSFSQFIHPTEDRDFYIREYARLMGYPDDFIFYRDECKARSLNCIAQGVPVNFIKYIAGQIHKAMTDTQYDCDCDVMYINQTSGKQIKNPFTKEEFLSSEDIRQKPDHSLF